MWDIFTVGCFLLYSGFILTLILGWRRINFSSSPRKINEFVSVIIPVRNEKENIEIVLKELEAQSYPKDLFEVLVINDHSTDNTATIVNQLIEATELNLKLLDMNGTAGKKEAISFGIGEAKGEYIAITDGDCFRGNRWLHSMISGHIDSANSLSFGLVSFRPGQTIFSEVLSLEQASLIGSGAALSNLGFPVMSNGANMVFDKDKFLSVRGFEGNFHVPSGDDEFLLTKFNLAKYKVGFISDQQSAVETEGPGNLKDLLNQRVRWAGKWRASKNKYLKLLAAWVFMIQALIVSCLFLVLFGKAQLAYFLLGFALKVVFDFVFISSIGQKLFRRVKLLPFVLLEIVYPFYAIFFALISNFRGYSWKNRNYKRQAN